MTPLPACSKRRALRQGKLFLCGFLLSALISLPIYSDGPVRRKPKPVDPCKAERSKIAIEEELRVALRVLRKAIDEYHNACERGWIGPLDRTVDDQCYPRKLEIMILGISPPNRSNVKLRFLRRIPIDPMTGKARWGLRSVQDEPGSFS